MQMLNLSLSQLIVERPILLAKFALLLGLMALNLTGPARAADDIVAAQSVIQQQAEAFGRDDTASAYSFAAPLIQEMFPQAETFMGMVRNNFAPVYRHKRFDFGEGAMHDGVIHQSVHIVDAEGVAWDALYTLERQADGSLKITSCTLKKVGETA